MKQAKIIQIFTFFLILAGIYACESDQYSEMPDVRVNELFFVEDMDYIMRGTARYFPGGFKGIIIYRHSDSEFRVYEAACPKDPFCGHGIKIDESGILATHPDCCDARYELMEGTPIEGSAVLPLKRYRHSYFNGQLHVTN